VLPLLLTRTTESRTSSCIFVARCLLAISSWLYTDVMGKSQPNLRHFYIHDVFSGFYFQCCPLPKLISALHSRVDVEQLRA
jgi:hypothetical protein